ncbi:hypothetical protein HQ520_11090, partial [bacterium]|nr:hypothetical protein [bacterium]
FITDKGWAEKTFGFVGKSPWHLLNPVVHLEQQMDVTTAVVPFLGAIVGCLWFLRRRNISRGVLFAFALGFLSTQFTAFRLGSMLNYYVEAYVWAVLVCSGVLFEAVGRLLHSKWRFGVPHPGWVLLLLIVFGFYGIRGERIREDFPALLEPATSWSARNRELVEVLNQVKGEVMLIEGFLYWHTQAPPTMLTASGYCGGVARGVRSPQPLIEKIRRHDFELIILEKPAEEGPMIIQGVEFFPAPVVRAVAERYRFVGYYNPFYLYR